MDFSFNNALLQSYQRTKNTTATEEEEVEEEDSSMTIEDGENGNFCASHLPITNTYCEH